MSHRRSLQEGTITKFDKRKEKFVQFGIYIACRFSDFSLKEILKKFDGIKRPFSSKQLIDLFIGSLWDWLLTLCKKNIFPTFLKWLDKDFQFDESIVREDEVPRVSFRTYITVLQLDFYVVGYVRIRNNQPVYVFVLWYINSLLNLLVRQ